MVIEKSLETLSQRVAYARDILGARVSERLESISQDIQTLSQKADNLDAEEAMDKATGLSARLSALEEELDKQLSPMDKVRIVRHPQRVCLKDILENVYDNYTEIGGRDEVSIDPGMLIARAYITRRVGKRVIHHPVMVVGQEKGHGQEFRNGGSIKPWGNAKALKYMKVAAQENIPIHAYVSTPGAYPVEDYPGAAQQIAENIYEMAGLDVPVVAIFSEGGSGGAEAIALADKRLMFSHGYYSVISPEGAAAIECKFHGETRATPELIEMCAKHQQITAQDNLRNGYIDAILQEPPLGARNEHFDFFKMLRSAVIRATDEVVVNVRSVSLLRRLAMRGSKRRQVGEDVIVRWELSPDDRELLVWRRYQKYRRMARHAYIDKRGILERLAAKHMEFLFSVYSTVRFEILKHYQKKIARVATDVTDEIHVVTSRMDRMTCRAMEVLGIPQWGSGEDESALTCLSEPTRDSSRVANSGYVSPKSLEDREFTCPHSAERGCLDIWARDLFGEFAGVCPNCGYHFPMEYQWYMANVFDRGSAREFNLSIAAGNPTNFPKFDERIQKAKQSTHLQSSCVTFNANIRGIRITCGMLVANFRGGTVGSAEGEKLIRALDLARKRHQPFLAYVHGTAGIRIQEGVNGLIQMPRVTMAVRRYIEEGGLYIVLYDTNSYAGPVASFLGCSPYQYAVRSSRIGFAGPGVIRDTTGMDIPPDYHSAYKALSRGHIQDIWDRRDVRANLHQAFLTMGGRNLYYR
ncbi:acetyl-CoA carboxylase carboxyl transferase subunit beta [Humidesulfovibrio mexicanus]|uniref:Acetyl-coenzyme A carboxylase carboxyl transferase subunits beta/alpha n=1 Tax=Humidesulfovibrio mexicanus TaxID=147047 RepID=A0A238XV38_9BACT|nr:carboxyl transferase domain-containing protein [Humidesulfovibrio mexicanus]SNR62391.1 acetyl-CoA carboxylase carboxyl transferase subunit beta [Humidesulfovibrio mexicanus]